LMDDFGELSRYRAANASLAAPVAGENRVVFYGDSITDFWELSKSFPQKPYINRGISGQTTAQMLLRFRQDVVNLHPKIVVILAGTNDIAGNTGPMTLEMTESNFASMAEIAQANGIRVVISSVLPVHNYTAKSDVFFPLRPPAKIAALNEWLKNYCAAHGDVYLDYHAPMLDAGGFLKREYADDGLHPNEAGFAVMTPLAEAAIRKALHEGPETKEKPGN
jgi:lysophospholipase L1-like esterase